MKTLCVIFALSAVTQAIAVETETIIVGHEVQLGTNLVTIEAAHISDFRYGMASHGPNGSLRGILYNFWYHYGTNKYSVNFLYNSNNMANPVSELQTKLYTKYAPDRKHERQYSFHGDCFIARSVELDEEVFHTELSDCPGWTLWLDDQQGENGGYLDSTLMIRNNQDFPTYYYSYLALYDADTNLMACSEGGLANPPLEPGRNRQLSGLSFLPEPAMQKIVRYELRVYESDQPYFTWGPYPAPTKKAGKQRRKAD